MQAQVRRIIVPFRECRRARGRNESRQGLPPGFLTLVSEETMAIFMTDVQACSRGVEGRDEIRPKNIFLSFRFTPTAAAGSRGVDTSGRSCLSTLSGHGAARTDGPRPLTPHRAAARRGNNLLWPIPLTGECRRGQARVGVMAAAGPDIPFVVGGPRGTPLPTHISSSINFNIAHCKWRETGTTVASGGTAANARPPHGAAGRRRRLAEGGR